MQLAFALLEKNVELDSARIRACLARTWDEPIALAAESGEGGAISFAVGERDSLILMPISAPIPDGEAEAMAGYSISSLGTGWQLGAHEGHVVVTLEEEDGEPSTRRLLRFSRLVAGVIDGIDDVIGIYSGEAHATHDPE